MTNEADQNERFTSPYSSGLAHRVLVFVAILILFLAGIQVVGFGGTVNTGDYLRVFQSTSITVPGWRPLASHYPLLNDVRPVAPESIMAVLCWLLNEACLLFQVNEFPIWLLSAILFGVYVSGVIALIRLRSIQSDLILIVSLITFVAFGFYVRSLYEEAIVMALTPALAFSVLRYSDCSRGLLLVVLGLLIILSKAEMVFILPLLAYGLYFGRRPNAALIQIIVLVVFAGMYAGLLAKRGGMGPVNNFNRYYNGIGYSVFRSSSWPVHTFNDRLIYFYTHRAQFESEAVSSGLPAPANLWGASYWPTGADISRSAWSTNTNEKVKEQILSILNKGALTKYFIYLVKNPKTAVSIGRNAILTAFKADYSLSYIRNPAPAVWSLSWLSMLLALGFYQISAFVVGCCIVFTRRWKAILVYIYFFIGGPIFVVMGDGYFEFEKHLVPILLLLPFVVSIVLCRKVKC